MAKYTKMRVVKGRKKDNSLSGFEVILYPFVLFFNILLFIWNLLFRFPKQPAYLVGFMRFVIWVVILLLPDYTAMESYFANLSRTPEHLQDPWMMWMVPGLLIASLMTLYSFCVMLGLNSNTEYHGGYEEYTNIDSMMQFIDGRLSSPGNRGKVLRKLFDE
jgi:hypothetical protein